MKRLLAAMAVLVCASAVLAENWPGWRGPRGDNTSLEKNIPIQWKEDNVRWKVKLPMGGNSSPVVWGDKIFITQSLDKQGKQRALLCLARADGKELWRQVVHYDEVEKTHGTNPQCAATPLTDGGCVVVSFGSAGMFCYDMDGKELWKTELGKLTHVWGTASSPIFYKDLVILWCGPGERAFLLAVDRKTGKEVWRHDEKGSKNAYFGSWSTPVIAAIDGRDELILGVPHKLKGFDPKTGAELWSCDGLGPLVYTSPSVSKDGIVVALSGYGGPGLACKAGGKGDVTTTHRLWHHPKAGGQRICSPMIVGDHFYTVTGKGMAQCFELKTGKELWGNQRLGDGSEIWGSFVRIEDRLYIVNNNGQYVVLKASPQYEQLVQNDLKETVRATIAISDGDMFIRGYNHLWCIREK